MRATREHHVEPCVEVYTAENGRDGLFVPSHTYTHTHTHFLSAKLELLLKLEKFLIVGPCKCVPTKRSLS